MNQVKFRFQWVALYFMAAFTLSAQTYLTNIPMVIDVSSHEIVNPGRGFYRWVGQEVAPVPGIDHYMRYKWSDLETARGAYNFHLISRELEAAQADPDGPGTFGFGIMSVRMGKAKAYPADLDAGMQSWYSTNKHCWVPDWNNTNFLARVEALVSALGAKFNGDPRLGWVEIRSYGHYGEWHMSGFEKPPAPLVPATAASKRRIIDAYVKAFPGKQLIMMSDDAAGLGYAMDQTNVAYPIGWRRDSWCHGKFGLVANYTNWGKIVDRWKTAPVIVESYGFKTIADMPCTNGPKQIIAFHVSAIGNGNFGTESWNAIDSQNQKAMILSAKTAGYRLILRSLIYPVNISSGHEARFVAQWSNVGVAPVYRDWRVSYQLRNQNSGAVVWEGVSKINLRSLLPTLNRTNQVDTPTNIADTFLPPAGLGAGTYDLEVLVSDPTGYSNPLRLAIQGIQTNGAFAMGTIQIGSMPPATKKFME